jgi:hypothetical protein
MPGNGSQRGKRLPATSKTQAVRIDRDDVELTLEEAKALDREIAKISMGMNAGCLELGKRLRVICKNPVKGGRRAYKALGYDSFADYCEKRLGMSRSKGYDLMSLSEHGEAGLITEQAVETTGWAKLSKLLPLIHDGIVTKKNIGKWLKSLEGKNFDEVKKTTKLAKIKADEKKAQAVEEVEEEDEEEKPERKKTAQTKVSVQIAPEEIYNLSIPLYKDQWENAQLALKKAQNITGSDKKPWLMDCIFTAFLSEGFSTKEEALEVMCQRIERAFSVNLIAMHSKSKQVVFGDRLIKLLQASESKKK